MVSVMRPSVLVMINVRLLPFQRPDNKDSNLIHHYISKRWLEKDTPGLWKIYLKGTQREFIIVSFLRKIL